MPITDPYSVAPMKPKKSPALASPVAPTTPDYPMADKLNPDQLQNFLDQGYVDYGDGTLIPPMSGPKPPATMGGIGQGPYSIPGLNTANPGANAAGGPPSMQTDIRSDIFKNLYHLGRQSGNPELMNIGRPPGTTPTPPLTNIPPLDPVQVQRVMPQLPPTLQPPPYTQASSQLPPTNRIAQSRFPRATALLSGARNVGPMRRGK